MSSKVTFLNTQPKIATLSPVSWYQITVLFLCTLLMLCDIFLEYLFAHVLSLFLPPYLNVNHHSLSCSLFLPPPPFTPWKQKQCLSYYLLWSLHLGRFLECSRHSTTTCCMIAWVNDWRKSSGVYCRVRGDMQLPGIRTFHFVLQDPCEFPLWDRLIPHGTLTSEYDHLGVSCHYFCHQRTLCFIVSATSTRIQLISKEASQVLKKSSPSEHGLHFHDSPLVTFKSFT